MSLFHVQLTIELRFKNVGVTTGCLKKCDPSSSTITQLPQILRNKLLVFFLNIQDIFFIMGKDIFKIDAAMVWKDF